MSQSFWPERGLQVPQMLARFSRAGAARAAVDRAAARRMERDFIVVCGS